MVVMTAAVEKLQKDTPLYMDLSWNRVSRKKKKQKQFSSVCMSFLSLSREPLLKLVVFSRQAAGTSRCLVFINARESSSTVVRRGWNADGVGFDVRSIVWKRSSVRSQSQLLRAIRTIAVLI